MINKLNNIQGFQLFCLENYRSSTGITGHDALLEFQQKKVFEYLSAGFDVLHTQGVNYILADIKDYIKRRK